MSNRFPASRLADFEASNDSVPDHFQVHHPNGAWFSTDLEGARKLAARPDADTITLLPVSIEKAE